MNLVINNTAITEKPRVKMLPITQENVLHYLPCTESRLHQVFIDPRDTEKKREKLLLRLLKTMTALKAKGKMTSKRVIVGDKEQIQLGRVA